MPQATAYIPMALLEASVSKIKDKEKSGMVRTGALVIVSLRQSKLFCDFGVQANLSFHKSEVR